MNKIKQVIDTITSLSIEFENKEKSISNAKEVVNLVKPLLKDLKNITGNSDEYLKTSTQIAGFALNNIIREINKAEQNFKIDREIDKKEAYTKMKSTLENALEVLTLIENLDMDSNFKKNDFEEDKNYIINSLAKISAFLSLYNPTSTPSNSPDTKTGCYIATMAYGDYNHPKVIILRKFRDDTLDKNILGKWLIKIYYYYSPKLVEKLKNKKNVNIIIRKTLNQFIKLIKK